jgi:hypothetical protein
MQSMSSTAGLTRREPQSIGAYNVCPWEPQMDFSEDATLVGGRAIIVKGNAPGRFHRDGLFVGGTDFE